MGEGVQVDGGRSPLPLYIHGPQADIAEEPTTGFLPQMRRENTGDDRARSRCFVSGLVG